MRDCCLRSLSVTECCDLPRAVINPCRQLILDFKGSLVDEAKSKQILDCAVPADWHFISTRCSYSLPVAAKHKEPPLGGEKAKCALRWDTHQLGDSKQRHTNQTNHKSQIKTNHTSQITNQTNQNKAHFQSQLPTRLLNELEINNNE